MKPDRLTHEGYISQLEARLKAPMGDFHCFSYLLVFGDGNILRFIWSIEIQFVGPCIGSRESERFAHDLSPDARGVFVVRTFWRKEMFVVFVAA